MDLNLLPVLDVLLRESSVTVAAERLGTSAPAISRSLARLRRLTGDPLLVRAGQGLVPTAHALAIRDGLSDLLRQADRLLGPGVEFDAAALRRTFTVQATDLLLTGLAVPLIEYLRRCAPEANVVFLSEAIEGTDALRRGAVDVEVGVLTDLDPETCREPLVETSLVGVARAGNPLFGAKIDAARFAAAEHIGVSRRGRRRGPIDDALAVLGLQRRTTVVVPNHTSAMLLARSTDLVTLTAENWSTTIIADLGLRTFTLPVDGLPVVKIGMAWHPRNDDDPAHQWFRRCLSAALRQSRDEQVEQVE